MTRYIFITGGVVSSLGKGIAAASLGAFLKACGFSVRIRKLDGYLNVDPGTMSPYQHGEVFVTEDGCETDLDLGHYERFTGQDHTKADYMTMGHIYATVIEKERRGDYLGGTVQVVPHVIDEIKSFITRDTDDADFIIVEIGGTVGDIESLPFLEAIRQLAFDLGRDKTLFVHIALTPYLKASNELKTKAAQHSVKTLLSQGIQPDMLLCRTEHDLSPDIKAKLGLFCNVRPERVMAAKDVSSIYEVPLSYHEEGFGNQVCTYFNIPITTTDLSPWSDIMEKMTHPKETVDIAIVGKYVSLPDAYKSVNEALIHGGLHHHTKVTIHFVDASDLEGDSPIDLSVYHGILVPGGFGERGIFGKMKAITYAREHNVPFLGICLGMQLAIIEAARHLAGLSDAFSTEFGPTPHPVVGLLTEWADEGSTHIRSSDQDLGGTMRLGTYPCHIKVGSLAHNIYGETIIGERHRHRYEVNMHYKDILEKTGIVFSGMSEDGKLPEMIERTDHPFFIAGQFHPEFKSRPFAPHPLFKAFVEAAMHAKLSCCETSHRYVAAS